MFQAIQTALAPEEIDRALEITAWKNGKENYQQVWLSAIVIAMSLWSSDSMETVLQNLVNGLNRQWTKLGQYWKSANSSSITIARQKLGCARNESII